MKNENISKLVESKKVTKGTVKSRGNILYDRCFQTKPQEGVLSISWQHNNWQSKVTKTRKRNIKHDSQMQKQY